MEKTEIPKETDYDALIEDLIQKIDNEKALFNLRYQVDVYNSTVTITVLLWVAAIVILALPNSIAPFLDRLHTLHSSDSDSFRVRWGTRSGFGRYCCQY